MSHVEPPDAISLSIIRTLCANGGIRQFRKSKYLSGAEVAVAIGVAPQVYFRWETAACLPRENGCRRLAAFYQELIAEFNELATLDADNDVLMPRGSTVRGSDVSVHRNDRDRVSLAPRIPVGNLDSVRQNLTEPAVNEVLSDRVEPTGSVPEVSHG